jgi:hypothetical protein
MSETDDGAVHDADFQEVLKALLSAYQPFLERELELARSPEALVKEASAKAPSCEDEIALGTRLLAPLALEENAIRILPADLREKIGPAEQWRWCILHIRCCLLFGWLVCRRRTFRAFAYYVERYWKCVREIVGTPVHEPPTAEERRDLQTIIDALATSFKPYLHGELSSVEAARGVSGELIAGKIGCDEGESATGEIFERLLSADISHALLGSAAVERQRENPFFVFCRCWCLCAIRLGCCLARARTLVDVLRCLYAYRRCLRDCFRPLFCAITKPDGCVSNEPNFDLRALVVPVYGSAGGLGFTHYTLEWSTDNVTFHASDFVYPPVPPGHPTQGNIAVTNGLLAYFDTTLLNPGTYFLRLTVYGQNATQVCEHSFSLFELDVAIRGADDYFTLKVPDMGGNYVPSNEYDPNAQFVQDVPALCSRPAFTAEMSFGSCLSIEGGAFVGGCDGRRVKRYTLEYKKGFETDPMTPGWIALSWQPGGTITYATPAQQRSLNDRKGSSNLTSVWGESCLVPWPFPPFCLSSDPQGQLDPSSWWTSETICDISGLITLRLTVEDTLGSLYYDTQRLWLDNKPLSASILIDAIPRCGDLFVSQFAKPADCGNAWNVPLRGIAFDELIDEMLAATAPNLNFDRYSITVEKQGGPTISVPIVSDPKNCCLYGTSRVGDPGTRCGVPIGPPTLGTLAQFDLRAVDPTCKSQVPCMQPIPDDFAIDRGTCCVYVFRLAVSDRTVSPCITHAAYADWPVKICNDLQP